VVEAYRHLVDPFEGMRPEYVKKRLLFHANVKVSQILDLANSDNRQIVRLTEVDLCSEIDNYDKCHAVARAAYEDSRGIRGILAPAATKMGITLALFVDRLPEDQLPNVFAVDTWHRLPQDPRKSAAAA
jgi:hypothetical protein